MARRLRCAQGTTVMGQCVDLWFALRPQMHRPAKNCPRGILKAVHFDPGVLDVGRVIGSVPDDLPRTIRQCRFVPIEEDDRNAQRRALALREVAAVVYNGRRSAEALCHPSRPGNAPVPGLPALPLPPLPPLPPLLSCSPALPGFSGACSGLMAIWAGAEDCDPCQLRPPRGAKLSITRAIICRRARAHGR